MNEETFLNILRVWLVAVFLCSMTVLTLNVFLLMVQILNQVSNRVKMHSQ